MDTKIVKNDKYIILWSISLILVVIGFLLMLFSNFQEKDSETTTQTGQVTEDSKWEKRTHMPFYWYLFILFPIIIALSQQKKKPENSEKTEEK